MQMRSYDMPHKAFLAFPERLGSVLCSGVGSDVMGNVLGSSGGLVSCADELLLGHMPALIDR